ncbi:RNA polymerase sigma factor [Candidatus Ulvibacter alkanivorans]|uniref:RNA polymerase sigma factor n=1 Tax=Candidatus Ulvibacter alkanivorans TaxID=2267620 RepID=UPI000DF119EC|nr:sigma-70 family RNA polymerase sigma factor [Candidatus Ulvibacter alkanivorans]
MKETTLIQKCIENDREAQGELYRRYKDHLFRLCLKYCKNRTEAEDTLQESFLTIFSKIEQYNGKGSFEGWMTRITINKAIAKYHKFRFTLPIKEDIVEQPIMEVKKLTHSLDEVLTLVQQLPDRYRLVFSLYCLDGYSHKEIAKLLNISVGTSKSNLHRAKQFLKERLMEIEKKGNRYGS